ncbi:MAG: DNA-protecting protein DprA [Synergistes sp.]|nr:DNA-protecting protein DprA [Synergistes sp.]
MSIFLTLFALQKIKGVGPQTICRLERERISGIETPRQIHELLAEIAKSSVRIKTVSVEEIERLTDEGKRITEAHDRLSVKAVNYFDAAYPENLRRIPQPPAILYYKGNAASMQQRGIAVIGARSASSYGQTVGRRIGGLVAGHGYTVISGLAAGCDTAGHTGCLAAGGITVAFVATLLDQTYPKKNTRLAEEIVEKNGCVASEYPVGTPCSQYFFFQRDRLQCGLAESVIVVECGPEGGTWHTIDGCLQLNKPLGCFAYEAEHYSRFPNALGNKKLLDSGKATALHDDAEVEKFIERSGAVQTSLF